jgi:hypothetical protein
VICRTGVPLTAGGTGGRSGLARDEREAARLYRLATDQGRPDAQNRLGSFYEDGRGGLAKDVDAAIRWYQAAARQANVKGSYWDPG